MSGERLLASFILRITVREGERRIVVMDMGRGTTAQFRNYGDLIRYLELGDEAAAVRKKQGRQDD